MTLCDLIVDRIPGLLSRAQGERKEHLLWYNILHGKTHLPKHIFKTNQATVYVQGDYMCLTMKYIPLVFS